MKPKRNILLSANSLLLIMFLTFFFITCKKTNNNQIVVTTTDVSSVTQNSAISGGDVTGSGSTITSRGVCWSVQPSPSVAGDTTKNGSGTGTFTSNIKGLSVNTKYYLRAYATGTSGTIYGNELTFTTQPTSGDSVVDIDGNIYHTISIGNQVWMLENMKVTRYRNGDSIPNVTDGSQWLNLDKGAYCNYDKNLSLVPIYGRLYNWYAVNDLRRICLEGWHVPTDGEWQTLIDYLGGEITAGGKMKTTGTLEEGTGLWNSPNTGANNESGLGILPGGYRHLNGNFDRLNSNGSFWSASEATVSTAWYLDLSYKYADVNRYEVVKTDGLSIRCIKDK